MTRTHEWHDLTGFQRDVLLVAASLEDGEEQVYGLAIKRELEARYGCEVNHGRLYPNLDTLVEAGFMEKSALDRRTNEYRVTPAGASLLDVAHDEIEDARDGLDARVVADGEGTEGDA
ncbi:helix-turn-helix transcriptional regulator [Halarchaeum sp. CBA1220]|uniref:PadR family transcriptional regulator n=1 Tax=Halarchaeum sp. CBA1220 TaxID=1853682 RepID=UPI000F3A96FD|nr:helix-turn-helix transcriptional regulator [Halarchaeum sp. CBA1220]QLC34091.1 helix-turn-helix transcriptional regulator [Halarchaeum sp. CBA1220]